MGVIRIYPLLDLGSGGRRVKDLKYYKEHIEECPVDILRVLYAEADADLYAANQIVGEQIDIIKALERQIEIKDAYCNMIYMLGVDYDGFNTVESLKLLIDELVNCAERAYRSDDKYVVGESFGGKCYNILYEEVEKPENFESMFKE